MGILLTQRQSVSLTRPGEPAPTEVLISCSWEPLEGYGNVDLDFAASLSDGNSRVVDTVSYRTSHGASHPIYLVGDNRTGEHDGEEQVIGARLAKLDAEICSIGYAIFFYSGHTFSAIRDRKLTVRVAQVLVGVGRKVELCRYDVMADASRSALELAKLYRDGPDGEWMIDPVGLR